MSRRSRKPIDKIFNLLMIIIFGMALAYRHEITEVLESIFTLQYIIFAISILFCIVTLIVAFLLYKKKSKQKQERLAEKKIYSDYDKYTKAYRAEHSQKQNTANQSNIHEEKRSNPKNIPKESKKQDTSSHLTKSITKQKSFLTPTEKEFKTILEQHLPDNIEIHCKVRLADILKEETTYRRLIMIHIDFLLLDKRTQDIVLAIELDDRSHNNEKAKERDALKNMALRESDIHYTRVLNHKKDDQAIIKRIVTFCRNRTSSKKTTL